jgi:hypothetical protein
LTPQIVHGKKLISGQGAPNSKAWKPHHYMGISKHSYFGKKRLFNQQFSNVLKVFVQFQVAPIL